MAHCWSVTVMVDGEERKVCTSHVPGNEALQRDLEARKPRRPTAQEVERAVEHHRKMQGKTHRTPGEHLEQLVEP